MGFLNFAVKEKWGRANYSLNYENIICIKSEIGPSHITIWFLDQKVEGFLDNDYFDINVISKALANKNCDYFLLEPDLYNEENIKNEEIEEEDEGEEEDESA
jgi:hypothetical protein